MCGYNKLNADLLAALRAITGYVQTNDRNGLLKHAAPHVNAALAVIERAEKEQAAYSQGDKQ